MSPVLPVSLRSRSRPGSTSRIALRTLSKSLFERGRALAVRASDDPLDLLPRARELLASLDTGDGVLIFSDIYGATPCNLATKLLQPGRVEGVAGVNLPMLVRAFTYRSRGMDTMIKKAISGGCDGVLHVGTDPVYATTRD